MIADRIIWSDDDAEHIRTRSLRPGNEDDTNIEPSWTEEVLTDPDRVHDEPDPKGSYATSVRIVGYSPSAGFLITVVGVRQRSNGLIAGTSAWKATGVDRRRYEEQE